jgi:hypothetical protein
MADHPAGLKGFAVIMEGSRWILCGRMDEPDLNVPLPVFSCGECGALVGRGESMTLHAEWHRGGK